MNTPNIINSQSAEKNAPSTEAPFNYVASVKRAADRKVKGITRDRQMLVFKSLKDSVIADYRSHFTALYGKTDRLPTDVHTSIIEAVTEHINKALGLVHKDNVISQRRAFYHKSRDMEITERVSIVGENALSMKEQLFGVNCFIEQANKRLKDLEAKPTPDYEREKDIKHQIMRLEVTKTFILREIKNQEELASK